MRSAALSVLILVVMVGVAEFRLGQAPPTYSAPPVLVAQAVSQRRFQTVQDIEADRSHLTVLADNSLFYLRSSDLSLTEPAATHVESSARLLVRGLLDTETYLYSPTTGQVRSSRRPRLGASSPWPLGADEMWPLGADDILSIGRGIVALGDRQSDTTTWMGFTLPSRPVSGLGHKVAASSLRVLASTEGGSTAYSSTTGYAAVASRRQNRVVVLNENLEEIRLLRGPTRGIAFMGIAQEPRPVACHYLSVAMNREAIVALSALPTAGSDCTEVTLGSLIDIWRNEGTYIGQWLLDQPVSLLRMHDDSDHLFSLNGQQHVLRFSLSRVGLAGTGSR